MFVGGVGLLPKKSEDGRGLAKGGLNAVAGCQGQRVDVPATVIEPAATMIVCIPPDAALLSSGLAGGTGVWRKEGS